MVKKFEMQPVARRDLLKLAGTGALTVVAGSLLPGLAKADAATASADSDGRLGRAENCGAHC